VALPGTIGHGQRRLQPLTLHGVWGGGEDPPEAGRRPISRLGDRSRQDGHARQQDLALDQPGRGQVEEQAGPLGADPGTGIKPTDQSGMTGLVGEIAVTIGRFDLVDVIPVGLADAVASQRRQVGDRQLPGDMDDDDVRDLGGIVEERPEKPDRSQLQGKAQPVVFATPRPQHRAISVVELEVTTELGGRGFAGVAAVVLLLLRDQEIDGHPGSFAVPGATERITALSRSIRWPAAPQVRSHHFRSNSSWMCTSVKFK
jgi:hypothetical protein